MSKLSLYINTIRHLRPTQISARLRHRLTRPAPDLRPAPTFRASQRPYIEPVALAPKMTGPADFVFVGVPGSCHTRADWNPRGSSKLWTYNLHYFDDLNAARSDERRAWHQTLVQRWIDENPPAHGVGWEPYPTSRRIVNWVKWSLRTGALNPAAAESLAAQTRWLMRRLEYHLLGNHLLANAKALVHAGLFFSGPEAESWLAKGLEILERELIEQVLGDGGHFELSPMYHAIVFEDLLDVANVLNCFGRADSAGVRDIAPRMSDWLGAMTYPDGRIGFFNDACFGIAPSAAELQAYACRLGIPARSREVQDLAVLWASGYVAAKCGMAKLVCDCAAVGPDYLPGHAHADSLSFELCIGSQRVFVNSGTSEYGLSAERHRQRGTAAHNTVQIDDENSSEVWAGFRVARRARVAIHSAQLEAGAVVVDASHDGYVRLPGKNLHRRRWEFREGRLVITDTMSGSFARAVWRGYLHPDIAVTACSSRDCVLQLPAGNRAVVNISGAEHVTLDRATWHPAFGSAVPSQCITAVFSGRSLVTSVAWDVT